MRKKFYITQEPYKTLMQELLDQNDRLVVSDRGVLQFDDRLAYYIAKATGLKSKKSRHIKKRFKIVIHDALRAMVEDHN